MCMCIKGVLRVFDFTYQVVRVHWAHVVETQLLEQGAACHHASHIFVELLVEGLQLPGHHARKPFSHVSHVFEGVGGQ